MPLAEPIPDIRSLDLLRSVAELGSIRQAAGAHHISQPAASMRLRSLEQTLDLDLLDRSAGRARLTDTGLAVVQWSEAVLEGMRDLLLATAAVRSEGRDTLRIAASMTVAEYLVPGWLNRLRGSDPDVSVSLEMGNSEHVARVMLRGGADIGFVEGPHDPPDLQTRVVAGDDLVVVVAPSHPWARRRRPLSAADLAATPLVLREAGSGTREVLERALGASGLEPIAPRRAGLDNRHQGLRRCRNRARSAQPIGRPARGHRWAPVDRRDIRHPARAKDSCDLAEQSAPGACLPAPAAPRRRGQLQELRAHPRPADPPGCHAVEGRYLIPSPEIAPGLIPDRGYAWSTNKANRSSLHRGRARFCRARPSRQAVLPTGGPPHVGDHGPCPGAE